MIPSWFRLDSKLNSLMLTITWGLVTALEDRIGVFEHIK